MSDRDALFVRQVIDSLQTVERFVNNGVSPSDAALQAYAAVEHAARAVPLPSPITTSMVAQINVVLQHTRAEFDALVDDPDAIGQESPFERALRHRRDMAREQQKLRAALRTAQAETTANAAAVAEDLKWVSDLFAERSPPTAIQQQMERGDVQRVTALVHEAVVARARTRPPARIGNTDVIVCALPRDRKAIGEGKRLRDALLAHRRQRLSRMSRLSDVRTTRTAAPPALILALVASAPPALKLAGGAVALYGGARGLLNAYLYFTTPTDVARADETRALSLFGESQGLWAQFTNAVAAFVASDQKRMQYIATEREARLRAWKNYATDPLDLKDQVQRMRSFYVTSLEYLDRPTAANLDSNLVLNIEAMVAAIPGAKEADPLPFKRLRKELETRRDRAATIDARIEAEHQDDLAGPGAESLRGVIVNEFLEYVRFENRTLLTLGMMSDQLAELDRLDLDVPPLQQQQQQSTSSVPTPGAAGGDLGSALVSLNSAVGADTTLFICGAVHDKERLVCVDPRETNVATFLADGVRQLRADPTADPSGVFVVRSRIASTPEANRFQESRSAPTLVIETRENGAGLASVAGSQAAVNEALSSTEQTGLDKANSLARAANSVIASTIGGDKKPARAFSPLVDLLPVLDTMGDPYETDGLRAGLASRYPPSDVMTLYGSINRNEVAVLARFFQLVKYVAAIDTVPTTDGRISFADYVKSHYETETRKLNAVVREIEALAGNDRAYNEIRTLTTLPAPGTPLRQAMIEYVETFIRDMFVVDLNSLWSFRRVLGPAIIREGELQRAAVAAAAAGAESSAFSLEPSDALLPSGGTGFLQRSIINVVRSALSETEKSMSYRLALRALPIETLVARQRSEEPGQFVRWQAVNGSSISPEFDGKRVVVHYVAAASADNATDIVDKIYSDPNRQKSFQKLYLLREATNGPSGVRQSDYPWTAARATELYGDQSTATGGVPDEFVSIDLGTKTFAIVRTYDMRENKFVATIAALSIGATRAAQGSNDTANATIASWFTPPSLSTAPLDSTDNTQLLSELAQLGKPVPLPETKWFSSITDPFVKIGDALSRFRDGLTPEAALNRTFTIGFEALASLAYWIELGAKIGGVVLDAFPALRATFARVSNYLRHAWEMFVTSAIARFVRSALGRAQTDGTESERKLEAAKTEWQRISDRVLGRSLSADPNATLGELPVFPDAKDALGNVWNIGAILYNFGAKPWRCFMVLLRALREIITQTAGVVAAITGFSTATTTDTLHSLVNTASFVLLVAVAPSLHANFATFASAAMVGIASRVSSRAFIEMMDSWLPRFLVAPRRERKPTPTPKPPTGAGVDEDEDEDEDEEEEEESGEAVDLQTERGRRRVQLAWRSALVVFGLLTPAWSWWSGSEYTTVAALGTFGSPALALKADAFVRPVVASTVSDATNQERAIELAVFAGSAAARIFAPQIYGWLRSLAAGRSASEEESVAATTVALSQSFVDAVRAGRTGGGSTSAYQVWAEIGAMALAVDGGRIVATKDRDATQLKLVAYNLLDHIEFDGRDKYVLALRTTNTQRNVTPDALERTLRQGVFAAGVNAEGARDAVRTAVRNVDLHQLGFEVALVYGKRLKQPDDTK